VEVSVLRRLLTLGLVSCLLAGPVAAADDSFFTHLHTEKAMANVTVSPARAGPVEIAIQLETMDEKPLTAKSVMVTLAMAGDEAGDKAGAKPMSIAAERRGDAQWLARLTVPKAGQWTLGLGIAISDTDKVSIQAPIVIK
jgi:copper transport protein